MSGERLVIALDLDGTLEDSRADMVAAVQRVRTTLGGVTRRNEDLEPHVSRGMTHLYKTCFDDILNGAGPGDALWAKVQRLYEREYLSGIAATTRLYDGVKETLALLSELAPLSCVTNKPEKLSKALLAALDVGVYFADVIGGDTTKEEKPSPVPLLEAIKRRGVNLPGNAWVFYIGDSEGDVRMARAAGARSIFCTWGYNDDPGDLEPDYVAERPEELVDIIKAEIAKSP